MLLDAAIDDLPVHGGRTQVTHDAHTGSNRDRNEPLIPTLSDWELGPESVAARRHSIELEVRVYTRVALRYRVSCRPMQLSRQTT